MKLKFFLLISFFLCYLEWGHGHSAFLFQVAYTIFFEKLSVTNFFHPLVFGSFLALLVLIISLFANIHQKIERIAIILLTLLVVFFLFIGVISLQYKVALSTFPYLFFANYYFKNASKAK
ncbi:hypothetical protein DI487_14785 [Flavobacterium sediminis]|uniref:Uncharacterized protein n=1 Tax=Flavobacterium sediminis TaxID=2201181 RepID=A0A2U8QXV4_9FLAO|nr:hypothetical protein [Flavobacterium sediminis]AWM14993.1 hypothetical protein DI487_14785 [Flavobacterium sediminis]